MSIYKGLIVRYRKYLPVKENDKIISLCEGNTPLIKLQNIPKKIGFLGDIYVKYEGLNPTGSFKDRGMTMAVTSAFNKGSKAIICASTGNTSASAAAFAARAKIRSFVLIPEGKIAMGKLAQAQMYGATIIQIKGNFDEGMELVKEVADLSPVTIVNSINPYRLQGQKTASFEIIDSLSDAPDYHCLPVGNAGNISAYQMGYKEFFEYKISTKLPKMCGYQAAGAAPFIYNKPIKNPETVATAIRIGNPQSWDKAVAATNDSGGWFDKREDEQILATQKLLSDQEGIFCEPASAVSVSGCINDIKQGKIKNNKDIKIVCTLTGNGLKDPDTAIGQCKDPLITIDAKLKTVKDEILNNL
jgi:threonine synthase